VRRHLAGARRGLWNDPATVSLTPGGRDYARRREALSAALAAHGIEARARSGINLWIEVPTRTPRVRGLLVDGWAVAAGSPFPPRGRPGGRITTAGARRGRRRATWRPPLARAVRPQLRTRAA
jgi:hypothetical protein